MYTIKERQKIQEEIIALAKSDERIVDAAIVGSESIGKNDEWSDVDLSFGVIENIAIPALMDDWTEILTLKYEATILFDISHKSSIYRVFLLPNCLQVDLSFTPSSKFIAYTPKIKLLFGEIKGETKEQIPNVQDLFGYAVLYGLKSKRAIERKKYWEAINCLNFFRDYSLKIACVKYKLDTSGRGFDDLPGEIRSEFEQSLNLKIDELALRGVLKTIINGLIFISKDMPDLKIKLTNQLEHIGH